MKDQTMLAVDSSKTTPIRALFITAALITAMGIGFMVFSVIANIQFPVMNVEVHGAVWGLIVMFLGVRFLFSVQRLKAEVYKSTSQFSWSNFKTEPRQTNRIRRK